MLMQSLWVEQVRIQTEIVKMCLDKLKARRKDSNRNDTDRDDLFGSVFCTGARSQVS